MRLHQLFSSLLIRWLGGLVLVFSAFSVMYAQGPTAPTAGEEPAKLDHIWQKASSKYVAERATLCPWALRGSVLRSAIFSSASSKRIYEPSLPEMTALLFW